MSTLDTFLVSLSAVGKAAALASTGIYLHRRKFATTSQSKEMLSRYSQQIGLPCLFFSKIVMSKKDIMEIQGDSLSGNDSSNGMLCFALLAAWPIYVVSCGLLTGYLLGKSVGLPQGQQTALLVATAFANSTGLPTTLLSMMTNLNDGNSTTDDPTKYLSLYLILYPVLQWGIGGWLLGLSESAEKRPSQQKQQPKLARLNSDTTSPSLTSQTEEDFNVELSVAEEEGLGLVLLEQGRITSTSEEIQLNSEQLPFVNRYCNLNPVWSITGRAFGQPPVVGALLGWIVATIPFLQTLWTEGALQWLGQAVRAVGQAAIPINMAVLGINLSMTFSNENRAGGSINRHLLVSVVVGKLIIVPAIGLISVWMLRSNLDLDPSIVLVLGLVCCTPTANAIMVMTDLSQALDAQIKQGMARMLASQYVVAPVLLSLWVMLTLRIAHLRE